jgi:uncharacterized membrane protein
MPLTWLTLRSLFVSKRAIVVHTLSKSPPKKKETTMRKVILTALGASLIAASTVQMAAAAEHYHGRKANRALTSQKFRNANDCKAWPSTAWPSTAESKFLLYHTVN